MRLFNNPEMTRNLWIEFNKRRLIAMPLGILAVFIVAYLRNGNQVDHKIAWVFILIYAVLTFLWGTKQAAESVVREVNLGTWHQQKMSTIGAWQMVWGKLLGSTVLVWYGNLFCFFFWWYTIKDYIKNYDFWCYLGLMIAFGFLSHAVTMLASLYSMRYRHSFEKFEVMFYQFLGLLVTLPMLWPELWGGHFGLKKLGKDLLAQGNLMWYGEKYPITPFVLVVLSAAILCALLGLYFLMRAEFLIDNSPLIWFSFALLLVLLIGGLDKAPENYAVYYRFPVVPGYAIAFNVALGMMYVLACGESRDALRLHLLKYYISSKQWQRFLAIIPRTIITIPIVILAAVKVMINTRLPFEGESGVELMTIVPYCIWAAVFFMLRDMGIIYLFSIKNKGRNNDTLTAILIILATYTLLPAFFISKNYDLIAGFFLPWPQDNLILTVIFPFMQAVVLAVLIIYEWGFKRHDWQITK